MSPTRVGLMGFGRIGRNLFRILYKGEDIRIPSGYDNEWGYCNRVADLIEMMAEMS